MATTFSSLQELLGEIQTSAFDPPTTDRAVLAQTNAKAAAVGAVVRIPF